MNATTDTRPEMIDALHAELNSLPETATTQRLMIESRLAHLNKIIARQQGLIVG
jgi:predicted component of type VI protein secretion system